MSFQHWLVHGHFALLVILKDANNTTATRLPDEGSIEWVTLDHGGLTSDCGRSHLLVLFADNFTVDVLEP